MRDEILGFIWRFKGSEDVFLNGLCYWFAYIMLSRFGCGIIIYDPIRGHFYWAFLDKAYDVEGEHGIPEHAKSLDYIRDNDSSLYERLYIECIRKDGD